MHYFLFVLIFPFLALTYPIIEKQYSTQTLNSFSLIDPGYGTSSVSGDRYSLGINYERHLSDKYSLGLNSIFHYANKDKNISTDLKIQNKYYLKGIQQNSFYALASPVLELQKNQKSRVSLDLGFGYQWLFGKKKNYTFNLGATSNLSKGELAISPALGFGLRF